MVDFAFGGGRLLGFLTKHRVDTLIISGGETDVCVLSTVLSAVDLGYRIILVEGALCSSSDESHDAILGSTVNGLISRSVLRTSNVSSVCGSRRKTAGTRFRDASSEARTLTPAHSDCASYLYPARPGRVFNICGAFHQLRQLGDIGCDATLSADGSRVVPAAPAASYKGRCMRPSSHPSPNAMATAV